MNSATAAPTLACKVTRSERALCQIVGGEAVLLDLASEQYFGLNPVGARIWTLLDQHPDLESVHRILCTEYDTGEDQIRSDLLELVAQLADAGLVELV